MEENNLNEQNTSNSEKQINYITEILKYSNDDYDESFLVFIKDKYGEEKIWRTMYYTLLSDGSVHIDFEFELPPGNLVEQGDAVYNRFFNCERKKSPKGKYPAKE